jgi:thioredoxin-like negative regulator of GroEL
MISKIFRFTAEWCAPCRTLAKTLEGFLKLPIEVFNIDKVPQNVVRLYNIKSVPVLLFLDKDGNVVDRLVGAHPINKIEEIINKHNQ